MGMRRFHADGEEKKPSRTVRNRKKEGNRDDELQVKMGKVVILAVEGIEYEVISIHLHDLDEDIFQGCVYDYGTFYAHKQMWQVNIIEVSAGGDSAAILAERAVNYFHPDVILLISTAYGIRDVQAGDVVSALKIYTNEARQGEMAFQAGTPIWNVNESMEQRARTEAAKISWVQQIRGNIPTIVPRVVFAPVASAKAQIMLTRQQFISGLQAGDENIYAVEMDGYELLQAARATQGIDTLVVCGITETIQRQNILDDDRRRVAAENASTFAFEVLAHLESQPEVRGESVRAPDPIEALEIFYSYVDADQASAEKLQKHLKPLTYAGKISEWDVSRSLVGKNLRDHQQHLETAHIIVLLISSDYLASDDHYKKEFMRAVERGRTGDAKVIPIHLRPSNLEFVDIAGLKVFPSNKKALTQADNQDQAFKDVAREIEMIVKMLRGKG